MKMSDVVKYSKQCAGFGCDRNETSEHCRECLNNQNELYKACCKYEKEINEYENYWDTKTRRNKC